MKVIITEFAWFIYPWRNPTANMSQVDALPVRFCVCLKMPFQLCSFLGKHYANCFTGFCWYSSVITTFSGLKHSDSPPFPKPQTQGGAQLTQTPRRSRWNVQLKSRRVKRKGFESSPSSQFLCEARRRKRGRLVTREAWWHPRSPREVGIAPRGCSEWRCRGSLKEHTGQGVHKPAVNQKLDLELNGSPVRFPPFNSNMKS